MFSSAYDVCIIGAGVSGCAIARELSKKQLSVCVVEAADDVCCGTSKANSAIVHAGFDAQTGSSMARLNVEGNHLMPGLCEELGVDFDQIGSLVVCTSEETRPNLEALLARGIANGVYDLRIIERDELCAMEPNVSDAAVCALWAPTAGIVNPFQLTVALAEVAALNGVEFLFNTQVTGVEKIGDKWLVSSNEAQVTASIVVNAAGIYADEIHNLVCQASDKMTIIPRRGQYFVLDTAAQGYVKHTVFALPTAYGKGVLVTPTTAGNILVGPTAEDIDDKEGVDTTQDGLAQIREKSSITMKDVPLWHSIRTFSGLRAHQPGHDFVIGEVAGAPGFVDCAAIESPGLTSAPAIGRMVAGIVCDIAGQPADKQDWVSSRRRIPDVEHMSLDEWAALIKTRSDYGRVICRCRHVTEGQIVDAIHAPIPATTLDAIKRRTETGMGRCQAGFCTPKVMEILEREVEGMVPTALTKSGPGSELTVGYTRPQEGGDA